MLLLLRKLSTVLKIYNVKYYIMEFIYFFTSLDLKSSQSLDNDVNLSPLT